MGAKGTHPPTTWMIHKSGKAEVVGFVSILTIGWDATSKIWKHLKNGKGKNSLQVVTVDRFMYTPVKVPSSWDAHLQAMVVCLEATNAILPSSLCADPLLPLEGKLAIFKATLDSPFIAPKDKALGCQSR